jgi:hypothetical protein
MLPSEEQSLIARKIRGRKSAFHAISQIVRAVADVGFGAIPAERVSRNERLLWVRKQRGDFGGVQQGEVPGG